MVPTQLPGPPCLYQEPNTHSNRVFRAPQRLSSTLKRCGDCPRRPTNTLGVRPEGPGRGNEEPPGTGNPHPGAAGLPGLPEATIIHPHRSPGEGSRGNPDSKALLPVRDGRRRSGQAAVGPSPCGHTRAGRKHGSPLSSGSRGDRSGSSNPARNAGMEPTGQRTHRLRDQPRGRPPAPATAQDHHQLQIRNLLCCQGLQDWVCYGVISTCKRTQGRRGTHHYKSSSALITFVPKSFFPSLHLSCTYLCRASLPKEN